MRPISLTEKGTFNSASGMLWYCCQYRSFALRWSHPVGASCGSDFCMLFPACFFLHTSEKICPINSCLSLFACLAFLRGETSGKLPYPKIWGETVTPAIIQCSLSLAIGDQLAEACCLKLITSWVTGATAINTITGVNPGFSLALKQLLPLLLMIRIGNGD